jgi:hypothetical protein
VRHTSSSSTTSSVIGVRVSTTVAVRGPAAAALRETRQQIAAQKKSPGRRPRLERMGSTPDVSTIEVAANDGEPAA